MPFNGGLYELFYKNINAFCDVIVTSYVIQVFQCFDKLPFYITEIDKSKSDMNI